MAAGAALVAAPDCLAKAAKSARPGRIALQLGSIYGYIRNFGLKKALADIAAIGYEGIEFCSDDIRGVHPRDLKKMLDDNGLVACGRHVKRGAFSPENYKKTCEQNLVFGNTFFYAPCNDKLPKEKGKLDDFVKTLCDFYNEAAQNCAQYGCKVGHLVSGSDARAFRTIMADGATIYVDRFLSNTDKAVQLVQNVASTMANGIDPCALYKRHPGRSFSLHAQENGTPGILGASASPNAVNWDALFPVTDKDGVQWYVVVCDRHQQVLSLVKQSFAFLKAKGRG